MKYKHLKNEGLPWLISRAVELVGIEEIVGKNHNPVIMKWAKDLGLGGIYRSDEIPWCGLFVAKVCQLARKDITKTPLWARSWARWGVQSLDPELGDVLVFKRGSGGHVGFYIAEDKECYHVLGGNQGNQVSITRIRKHRLIAARRPKYNVEPSAINSYFVNSEGEVSNNEA